MPHRERAHGKKIVPKPTLTPTDTIWLRIRERSLLMQPLQVERIMLPVYVNLLRNLTLTRKQFNASKRALKNVCLLEQAQRTKGHIRVPNAVRLFRDAQAKIRYLFTHEVIPPGTREHTELLKTRSLLERQLVQIREGAEKRINKELIQMSEDTMKRILSVNHAYLSLILGNKSDAFFFELDHYSAHIKSILKRHEDSP